MRCNDLGPASSSVPVATSSGTMSSMFQAGSPSRCVGVLAILAVLTMLLGSYLPGARKAILPTPYGNAQQLVLIVRSGSVWAPLPTIPLSEYVSWTHNTHQMFRGLAFYQPIQKRVHLAPHQTAELSIARASDNLLTLLQTPIDLRLRGINSQGDIAKLILSHRAWEKYFHGDTQIDGRVLQIAGQRAMIVGVMAKDRWRLPGQMDAWLLENPKQMAILSPYVQGYVLGDIRSSTFSDSHSGLWTMRVPHPDGSSVSYDCVSLVERSKQPYLIFLFALALACLALPATTSLLLGEYPASCQNLPPRKIVRRWIFLFAKLAWLILIVYFGGVDLAHLSRSIHPLASQYIQLGISFFALLFLFRWALLDQRKRCPQCLRVLTHPARVGQFSRNFLAWNGTELICTVGHGLLHVPDMPTSWFSTQRWLYLDTSWRGLF